jgi:hypothetical protein
MWEYSEMSYIPYRSELGQTHQIRTVPSSKPQLPSTPRLAGICRVRPIRSVVYAYNECVKVGT